MGFIIGFVCGLLFLKFGWPKIVEKWPALGKGG